MQFSPCKTDRTSRPRPMLACCLALVAFTCAGGSVCAQSASAEPKDIDFEYLPYRVKIAVAFANEPRLTPAFQRQVLNDLRAAVERSVGGQWQFQIESTARIAPASALGLERLEAKDFVPKSEDEDEPPPQPFDKQFFLTVTIAGSKYQIAGREWDEQTQELSVISHAETYERRAVPEALFRVISDLFHPILAVQEVDLARKTIALKLRAGGHVPVDVANDPKAELLRVQVRPGTLLIAFFRYHNKDGTVREVQFLPWTYLVVDSVERGRVQASLVTGIRTPLGAKTSKRVHSLAVARRVQHPSTTLQIELRNNPRKKLAGHYITATAEKYPDEKTKTPELFKRITDRLGRLDIPVIPEQDILWLRVHSGTTLLALVPFAPGLVSEMVLDLPDDSIRLAVEGDLTQIRAELVDTVARRATLMIRARKAVAAEDWKTVDEEMASLDKLPSLSEFRKRIDNIRVEASRLADEQNSRLTKRRVADMCGAATDLVQKYLSEERINLLKEEIRESRSAQ